MITKKEAGTVNGKAVAQYTLENENGLAMTFYTYGGIIQSLLVKDRQGIARDVELGFDTLDEYVKAACYYGAPIGRYANRIGGAKFTMDGREYHLTANENGNTLHGGNGLTFRVWQAVKEEDGGEPCETPAPVGGGSAQDRLTELRALYDQRLITQEEYEEKRREILKDL